MTYTGIPRKTIILATVLAVLVAIFVIQERGGNRRNTVPIPEISGEIDQIRIVAGDEKLRFYRRDAAGAADAAEAVVGEPGGTHTEATPGNAASAAWTMGEEAYPVNPDALAAIEKQIIALREVDVVTSRGNPADYGLTEETSRTLRIFTGDLEPVALEFGDTAAAGNAVYGRLNGGDAIVLLPQALDTAVAVDPLRYREKTMAAVPEAEIVEVRITSPAFETGRVVERTSGAPVRIDLWRPVEERVPAAASTTPYRFYLPEWRARRLLLGIERFL
jgi:hypothetical protein